MKARAPFSVLVLALVAGSGCASNAPEATAPRPVSSVASVTTGTTTVAAARPYVVDVRTVGYIDASRVTAVGEDEIAPSRTLTTDLYVPEGAGPFPLIVFAHGYDGHPRKFTELLGAWASAGYVVAAPAFPLTNDEATPRTVADYNQQPGDVSFVMTEVLDDVPQADAERVGVAGLSWGGATTYGVAFNDCCRDDRIDAAIAMAANRLPFDGEYDFSGIPKMFVHGDADRALPYENTVETYAMAAAPKYFVTLEHGAHAPPFENTPSDHDTLVRVVTLDFWDATLLGDGAAADRIRVDGTVAGLSHVEEAR